jgi:hypothetical protein
MSPRMSLLSVGPTLHTRTTGTFSVCALLCHACACSHPSTTVKLHDAIVDLFRRSGAPTSGFPYHRNERAKQDHQELYDFIDVVVCQICRCFRQEAHMSTVLAAILYVRRSKPLQGLGKESRANINRLADLVLLSSLMLADTVRGVCVPCWLWSSNGAPVGERVPGICQVVGKTHRPGLRASAQDPPRVPGAHRLPVLRPRR